MPVEGPRAADAAHVPLSSRKKNALRLADLPPSVPALPGQRKLWRADYAARIAWYPKTEEAFIAWQDRATIRFAKLRAEGQLKNLNCPRGWAGRRAELLSIRHRAAKEAKKIVAHMRATNVIQLNEDPRAEEALEAMIAIVRAKDPNGASTSTDRDRISAANTVLTYTKQKPATNTAVTVRKAEDYLDDIAEEMATGVPMVPPAQ